MIGLRWGFGGQSGVNLNEAVALPTQTYSV